MLNRAIDACEYVYTQSRKARLLEEKNIPLQKRCPLVSLRSKLSTASCFFLSSRRDGITAWDTNSPPACGSVHRGIRSNSTYPSKRQYQLLRRRNCTRLPIRKPAEAN